MYTVIFVEIKIAEAQSHQLAFKMTSIGDAWEFSTSYIISLVVGVWWGFYIFCSFLLQSLSGAVR